MSMSPLGLFDGSGLVQEDSKDNAIGVFRVGCREPAPVDLGDDTHDIETEPEVGTVTGAGLGAHRNQRIE